MRTTDLGRPRQGGHHPAGGPQPDRVCATASSGATTRGAPGRRDHVDAGRRRRAGHLPGPLPLPGPADRPAPRRGQLRARRLGDHRRHQHPQLHRAVPGLPPQEGHRGAPHPLGRRPWPPSRSTAWTRRTTRSGAPRRATSSRPMCWRAWDPTWTATPSAAATTSSAASTATSPTAHGCPICCGRRSTAGRGIGGRHRRPGARAVAGLLQGLPRRGAALHHRPPTAGSHAPRTPTSSLPASSTGHSRCRRRWLHPRAGSPSIPQAAGIYSFVRRYRSANGSRPEESAGWG